MSVCDHDTVSVRVARVCLCTATMYACWRAYCATCGAALSKHDYSAGEAYECATAARHAAGLPTAYAPMSERNRFKAEADASVGAVLAARDAP